MYRIVGIYNKDEKRTVKIVEKYPLRVGRIISDETILFAIVGSPLILQYVTDEHEIDYGGHYLRCSRLRRKSQINENTIELETQNTIYVLKRMEI